MDERVLKDPAPEVLFDATRGIKEAFDNSDIEIPFPQHVVHMTKD